MHLIISQPVCNSLSFEISSLLMIGFALYVWRISSFVLQSSFLSMQVVKGLLESYDIINSKDNQGNTALNVAAYRGHLAVLQVLILASPSSIFLTNNYGDTFLHMAVAGFHSPGFRRLDRQIELMNRLAHGKIVDMEAIINAKNNDGRTALHMAVIGKIQLDVVELLTTVPSINLNTRDGDGMTPLDLLKQRPQSASSEILIKKLTSAGGIANCWDVTARSALVSQLKMKGIGSSPGTSFRISDAEILVYSGIENTSEASHDLGSTEELSSWSSELDQLPDDNKRSGGSVNNAARRLKILLHWPRKREGKTADSKTLGEDDDDDSSDSYKISRNVEDDPTPLRQRFSRLTSLPNNKRVVSCKSLLPSPSTKKKYAVGLMHGVIRAMPELAGAAVSSSSPPFRESPVWSPRSAEKQKGIATENGHASPSTSNQEVEVGRREMKNKQNSFNKKLMNQYFCFGAHGIAVENSIRSQSYRHAVV